MNSPAVNLGAGGFVSYYEDGGATVVLDDTTVPEQEQQFDERGVGTFFLEQYTPFASPPEGAQFNADKQSEIRASGNPGSAARETYYGDDPTFFETLSSDYGYPLVQDPIAGPNRHGRPVGRQDLPTPQELADARGHALGTSMVAADYGPKTAMTVGNLGEDIGFSDRRHRAQDKRNNAVGISLFKQAGIDATPQQLTQMVDGKIFQQLEAIMARPANERRFESDKDADMDLYFPRDSYGYFVSDH